MDFSKILPAILPAIEMAAPTIAGLLGGPLASMGVTALENALGLEPGTAASNPQAVISAVANMTPDTAVALARIDADLKMKLADTNIAIIQAQVASDAAQIAVNAAEAAGGSFYNSGWRPAVAWICVVAFGLNYIVNPLIAQFLVLIGAEIPIVAAFDMATMMPVLIGLLGLGGMRSYEKVQGIVK